jgi:hypothetical protein
MRRVWQVTLYELQKDFRHNKYTTNYGIYRTMDLMKRTMFFEGPLKNPNQNSPLPTKMMKTSGKTLQKLG